MERVVITGGAGFIGSHLCDLMLNSGFEVVCADNFSTGSLRNIAHLLHEPAFHLLRTDVTEGLHVDGDISAVLHFASPASPVDYLRLPIETLKVGSVGTMNALNLARARGSRFLLASTSEVYGDPQVHPQPEEYWGHVNPIGPRSVYDEAKRFAEALTLAYSQRFGMATTIVRLFNTYGPRMRRHDGRAIPTFIYQALRNAPITVAGDGSQTRSVCHIDDTVEGVRRLLDSGHPGPVNVGNPEEMSVLALAELVREVAASTSSIVFRERPQDDPGRRRPDITRARDALGWEPKIPAREGIRSTIDWFRQGLADA